METHARHKHIMLLDDEQSVMRALQLLLKAVGYQVTAFHVPEEAISFLEQEHGQGIDLIVCDLRMPKTNGLAVLKQARQFCPAIPFVLMSAHADIADVKEATQLGAAGFLAKPFSPDQFHELVEELCGT
ncbi:response regulator [Oligoflexia bacterium]|nr:response regulator [Oligoflexia bacterium]